MPSLVPAGVRAAQPLDTWCLPIGRSLVVTALDAHDLPLGFVFSIRDPSPVLVVAPTQVNMTHVWKVDRVAVVFVARVPRLKGVTAVPGQGTNSRP